MFRYIGNKSRLTDAILRTIEVEIGKSGIVADIMAGTGSVAFELRKKGYKVISSDVMTYSKYHCIVQLLINKSPNFDKLTEKYEFLKDISFERRYEAVQQFLMGIPPVEGYFYKEFSPDGVPENGTPPRKYFSSENAVRIDSIRLQLNEWKNSNLINDMETALLFHDLIMASNEVANISGTYGYFLSSFCKSSLESLKLKPTIFYPEYSIDHKVLQGYAEDIAGTIKADLCYIDPPYMKRQYAANYHILETLARGDEPEAVGLSGLRPWRDQYSNFCSKVLIRDSFRKVFSDMDCKKFIISYSEDGLLDVQELVDLFSDYGNVVVNEIEYKRFRSNNSSLGQKIKEYIIKLDRR